MPLKPNYRRLDESYFRSVYLGILYELTDSIWIPGYEQVESYSEIKGTQTELEREYNDIGRVFVPFFLNMGYATERFWQDAFLLHEIDPKKLLYTDKCGEKLAEGNYDPVPRGILTPNGIEFDSGANTNPHVRGRFFEYDIEKEEYREFNSKIRALPIKLPCSGSIFVDNQNDAWFVVQRMIELYNRVRIFSYNWKGIRGEGQFKLATSYEIERTFEFTYPQENKILVNFNLDVEAIMPIFDPYKKFDAGNVINNLPNTINIDNMPDPRVPTNPNLVGTRINNFVR